MCNRPCVTNGYGPGRISREGPTSRFRLISSRNLRLHVLRAGADKCSETPLAQIQSPRTQSSFEETLAAARQGEDWAWEILYGDLAGPVTGYLRSRGARDPEDVAGETFLQVARDIHRFTGDEASFRSWVFVIAHRRLIDHRRSLERRPDASVLLEDHEAPGGDVEDEAMKSLDGMWVQEILDELTDEQRHVLTLRVIADLSLRQTAEVMGKRVGAIKALQRRALASARDLIAEGKVSL